MMVGGRRWRQLWTTVTVMAVADSGRWLQTLAFNGRGMTAALWAAATVEG
jgi:hypothetical protein